MRGHGSLQQLLGRTAHATPKRRRDDEETFVQQAADVLPPPHSSKRTRPGQAVLPPGAASSVTPQAPGSGRPPRSSPAPAALPTTPHHQYSSGWQGKAAAAAAAANTGGGGGAAAPSSGGAKAGNKKGKKAAAPPQRAWDWSNNRPAARGPDAPAADHANVSTPAASAAAAVGAPATAARQQPGGASAAPPAAAQGGPRAHQWAQVAHVPATGRLVFTCGVAGRRHRQPSAGVLRALSQAPGASSSSGEGDGDVPVLLRREPTNPVDVNAIQVSWLVNRLLAAHAVHAGRRPAQHTRSRHSLHCCRCSTCCLPPTRLTTHTLTSKPPQPLLPLSTTTELGAPSARRQRSLRRTQPATQQRRWLLTLAPLCCWATCRHA